MINRAKGVLAAMACCLALVVDCNATQEEVNDKPPPVGGATQPNSSALSLTGGEQRVASENLSTHLQYAPAIVHITGKLGIATGEYANGDSYQYLTLAADTQISVEGDQDNPSISGLLKIGVIPKDSLARAFDALIGRKVTITGSLFSVPAGRGPSVNIVATEINEGATQRVGHPATPAPSHPPNPLNEKLPSSQSSLPNEADSSVSIWPWVFALMLGSATLLINASKMHRRGEVVIFISNEEAIKAALWPVLAIFAGLIFWFFGTWFLWFSKIPSEVAVPFAMFLFATYIVGNMLITSFRTNSTLKNKLLSFGAKMAFGVLGIIAMIVSLALAQKPQRREDESSSEFADRVASQQAKAAAGGLAMSFALALFGLSLVSKASETEQKESDMAVQQDAAPSEMSADEYRHLLLRASRQLENISSQLASAAHLTSLRDGPEELRNAHLQLLQENREFIEKLRDQIACSELSKTERERLVDASAELISSAHNCENIIRQL